ncbi:MAG: polysaccharide biosynthesis/export family protein, partial [Pseudomonadota bacterium]
AAAAGAAPTPAGDYQIGPGDVLEISAWKNVDLSRVVTVLPDGRISFPLLGEIVAGGKSPAALRDEMVERLKRFSPDPGLTVTVQQVNSMWIYVIGRVRQPGRFQVNGAMNVMQALAVAGGLDSFADRDRIAVFRETGGKTVIFDFDYDDVASGKRLEQNIALMRGDVVVVR